MNITCCQSSASIYVELSQFITCDTISTRISIYVDSSAQISGNIFPNTALLEKTGCRREGSISHTKYGKARTHVMVEYISLSQPAKERFCAVNVSNVTQNRSKPERKKSNLPSRRYSPTAESLPNSLHQTPVRATSGVDAPQAVQKRIRENMLRVD